MSETDEHTADDEQRPSPEEYRELALKGTQLRINEAWELSLGPIRDLRADLRDGEDPEPSDLLNVRHSFLIADRETVDALDDVVVGEESATVRELRERSQELDESLIDIALACQHGRQIEQSTYETARESLEAVTRLLNILDDKGCVAAPPDEQLDAGDLDDALQEETQGHS